MVCFRSELEELQSIEMETLLQQNILGHDGEVTAAGAESVGSYRVYSQVAESEESLCSGYFSLSSIWDSGASNGVGLPTPTYLDSWRYFKKSVSMVILNPLTLTDNLNHQTCQISYVLIYGI